MTHERYIYWMRVLFDLWGGSRQELADIAGVSKSTIDDFFAGRRKDISRTTAGLLEDTLVGGDSKWPCAMLLDQEKEIVYQDRPETVDALRISMENLQRREQELSDLQKRFDAMEAAHRLELQKTKEHYEEDIREYKELVAHMRIQVNRKDNYIDRLSKKAGI